MLLTGGKYYDISMLYRFYQPMINMLLDRPREIVCLDRSTGDARLLLYARLLLGTWAHSDARTRRRRMSIAKSHLLPGS